MEEGIFPGMRSIGDAEEMEEERRLCYVALTRAKQQLLLTCANQRMLFGHTTNNRPSRFTGEIPPDLLEQSGRTFADRSQRYFDRESFFDDDFNQTRPAVSTWQNPYGRGERRTSSGGASAPSYSGSSYGGRSPSAPRPAPTRKQPISARPSSGYTAPAAAPANLPSFQKGDMVDHKAFGKGMVLSVQKMGGDALLEIAFDNVGTKKLMLKAASQHMKKI
jgi:DNA helicase-2/ATP-dependent DNA helicase PcrA